MPWRLLGTVSGRICCPSPDAVWTNPCYRNTRPMVTTQSVPVSRPSGATFAIPLILLAVCYAATATTMVEIWSTQAVYSYGFLVPVISGYICWSKWQEHPVLGAAPD